MSEADEDDRDGEVDIDDLFPFLLAEENLIDILVKTIRAALPTLEPVDVRKMATFLFALERLPYATPGVSMDVGIMERVDGNLSYVSVEIDDGVFRLSTGGHVYSPDVGGDSYSETYFHLETGGFREGTSEGFENWLESFGSAAGTYAIEEIACDEIDLTEEARLDGWDRLEAYWESHGGEDEFGY